MKPKRNNESIKPESYYVDRERELKNTIENRHESIMTSTTMQTYNTVSTGLSDKLTGVPATWIQNAKNELSNRELIMYEQKQRIKHMNSLDSILLNDNNAKVRKRNRRYLGVLVVIFAIFGIVGFFSFSLLNNNGDESEELEEKSEFTSTQLEVIENICSNFAKSHANGSGAVFNVCLGQGKAVSCVVDSVLSSMSSIVLFSGRTVVYECEDCLCGVGSFVDVRGKTEDEVQLNSCGQGSIEKGICVLLDEDEDIDLEELFNDADSTNAPTLLNFDTKAPTPLFREATLSPFELTPVDPITSIPSIGGPIDET